MVRAMQSLMAFAFAALLAFGARAADANLAPDALVERTTKDVLEVLKKDEALRSDSKRLIELIDARVLPHFDFERMTRLAVGRPWRDASPAQQQALVREFRTLLVRTYSKALEQYKDESIEVRPLQVKPGETEVLVRSAIRKPGNQQPITLDYRMEKQAGGWKIYDVLAEGVSIVTTYRSTFASEVAKSGIDGLIKTIADQNARLAGSA